MTQTRKESITKAQLEKQTNNESEVIPVPYQKVAMEQKSLQVNPLRK